MNWSTEEVAEVPPVVVTVTSTKPADSAGEVAEQLVTLEHVTAVAAVTPNLALVDPTTKPVPVMVTTVVPAKGPEVGAIEVIAGTLR